MSSETQTALATAAHTPAYKRLTDADRVTILRWAKQGMTQVEIAKRLDCDQSSVSRWLNMCADSTTEATQYLRGSALRMARNVVNKGQARDHIQALKGIQVIEDGPGSTGVQININGFALVGLSPRTGSGEGQQKAQQKAIGSDKQDYVNHANSLIVQE